MKDGIILVGGFPEPVGGVTTFVRRLAASESRQRRRCPRRRHFRRRHPHCRRRHPHCRRRYCRRYHRRRAVSASASH